MIQLEWDESKRQSNLEKHGFDFLDAGQLLAADHIEISAAPSEYLSETEHRTKAIGIIQGRFAAVIFTMRSDIYRIISVRNARRTERADYAKAFGKRPDELG